MKNYPFLAQKMFRFQQCFRNKSKKLVDMTNKSGLLGMEKLDGTFHAEPRKVRGILFPLLAHLSSDLSSHVGQFSSLVFIAYQLKITLRSL